MACAYIILARSKRIGPLHFLHCTCQWFLILGAATHWSDLVVSLGRRTIFAPSRRVKHRPIFIFFCLFFVLFIALIVNATLVKMRLFAVHEVLQRNIKCCKHCPVTKIFVRLKFFILGQNISETFYPSLKFFVRSLKNARGNEKSDVWERFLRRCLYSIQW